MLTIFVNVILPVFLVAALGFAFEKRFRPPIAPFNQLALFILMPALIFQSLLTVDFRSEEPLRIAAFALLLAVVMLAIGLVIARLARLDRPTASAFLLTAAFPNLGNYGLPVVVLTPSALFRPAIRLLALGAYSAAGTLWGRSFMRRSVSFALATLLILAFASPAAGGSTGWKVYTYNASGNALSSKQADGTADNPSFAFTTAPDTALFAESAPVDSLLGKTITATYTISGPTGAFTYYGEGTPSNPCGTPASARFYFSSNGSMGSKKDWYSNFWWSNPASAVLANGTWTITATVTPDQWSNWNGKSGTIRADAFAAAAAKPDLVGFSFGGGCFFENGVGAPGAPTFTLTSFVISGE